MFSYDINTTAGRFPDFITRETKDAPPALFKKSILFCVMFFSARQAVPINPIGFNGYFSIYKGNVNEVFSNLKFSHELNTSFRQFIHQHSFNGRWYITTMIETVGSRLSLTTLGAKPKLAHEPMFYLNRLIAPFATHDNRPGRLCRIHALPRTKFNAILSAWMRSKYFIAAFALSCDFFLSLLAVSFTSTLLRTKPWVFRSAGWQNFKATAAPLTSKDNPLPCVGITRRLSGHLRAGRAFFTTKRTVPVFGFAFQNRKVLPTLSAFSIQIRGASCANVRPLLSVGVFPLALTRTVLRFVVFAVLFPNFFPAYFTFNDFVLWHDIKTFRPTPVCAVV